jgi:L-lysine 2,3-aminomutase
MLQAFPRAVVCVVHLNHARELDESLAESLRKLRMAGVVLLNQAVLLKGVNDRVDTLVDLSERLIDCGIVPYYLHQLDRVAGAAHYEVPESTGRRLVAAMRAQLPGYAVPAYVRDEAGAPHKLSLE